MNDDDERGENGTPYDDELQVVRRSEIIPVEGLGLNFCELIERKPKGHDRLHPRTHIEVVDSQTRGVDVEEF